LKPVSDKQTLDVLVRSGTGHALRRRGELVASGVQSPDATEGWDRVRIEGTMKDVASELLTLGTKAYAESPPEFREHVAGRLDQMLAGPSASKTGSKR